MKEEGVVVETHGEFARVEAKRGKSCEGCAAKGACRPGGDDSMIIEALNPIHARTGDRVSFELAPGALLKSTFLLYMMPVIFLVAGAVIGEGAARIYPHWGNKETLSILSGGVFFLISVLALALLNKRLSKNVKLKPVIKDILSFKQRNG